MVPAIAAVDEAEKASCTFRLPAIVVEPVDISAPSKMARPEKAEVDEADSAPDAAMVKRDVLVESTKRSMSPVCERVVEASIKVPSVEVAKILKRAFWLIATAFVVVPMYTERAPTPGVVVGAR